MTRASVTDPETRFLSERGEGVATNRLSRALLFLQGGHYGLTGVWPLVHVESFQGVTGRKTDHLTAAVPREADHWLLMTVGALITVIAFVLFVSAWRRQTAGEIALLAVASAVSLTAIDVVYVARQTIPPIYLADAVAEVLLLIAWALVLLRRTDPRLEP